MAARDLVPAPRGVWRDGRQKAAHRRRSQAAEPRGVLLLGEHQLPAVPKAPHGAHGGAEEGDGVTAHADLRCGLLVREHGCEEDDHVPSPSTTRNLQRSRK